MRSRASALAVGLILVAAAPAIAQLSPGPLSEAHADLEGVSHCLDCHGLEEEAVDADCLKCHREIEWLIANDRGFHGLTARDDCAACHPEHGGREFELVEWPKGGTAAYDHRDSGWELTGRHAEAECRKCHRPELRRSPAASRRPGGLGPDSWLGLETACRACHEDPHADRFGPDCGTCHGAGSWREIREESFDHDRTRYPLGGAHRGLECAKCHDAERAWGARPAYARCDDCHVDAHAGRATLAGQSVDCDACHSVRWFRPSTYTAARHRESTYPLEGRHAKVKCESCHARSTTAAAVREFGTAGVDLRPSRAACADCHSDAHAGQLAGRSFAGHPGPADCSVCHDVDGFRPSLFTVADHRESRFPLEGRHAEATCAACHGPERRLLPPLPGTDVTGTARILFRPPAEACADCHRDPHEGRFSPGGTRPAADDCRSCHGENSFRPATYDATAHDASRFRLAGAHRAVPCFECHLELMREASKSTLLLAPAAAALPFTAEKRACADCHENPHGGQFAARPDGGDCAVCHGVDSFRPTTGFDHERDSAFPRDGAHVRVACDRCHSTGPLPSGVIGIVYRPLGQRCEDCHTQLPPDVLQEGSR